MSGARASAAVAAVLGLGLSGCLDFVEPEPGPGRLEALLDVRETEPSRAHFRARFSPGGTADGTVRSVENPRIRILDTAVEPSEESGVLRWIYRRNLDFDLSAGEVDRQEVELVGPRLAGGRSPAVLTLPLVRRAGPDSVRLSAGEPLELPVGGGPDGSRRPLERIEWALSIRPIEGSGVLFSARGAGSLPDTLRVQADALEGASGPLEASLNVQLEATEPAAGSASGYEATLQVTTRLAWEIIRG